MPVLGGAVSVPLNFPFFRVFSEALQSSVRTSSKIRIAQYQEQFRIISMDETKRTHRFRYVLCFGGRWWIRTTEVIDDRFTVCSLWPLGKPSIFDYQLDWSWWTDLNPRPADYKSAALPTELHQHFIKSSCLSDLFSIPHAGVFVNRFIRNYCILFFRSIESDTCCRTVSSALDKSG